MLVWIWRSRFVSRRPGTSTIWSTSSSKNSWTTFSVTPSWVAPTSVQVLALGVVFTAESAGSVAPNAPVYSVPGPAIRLVTSTAISVPLLRGVGPGDPRSRDHSGVFSSVVAGDQQPLALQRVGLALGDLDVQVGLHGRADGQQLIHRFPPAVAAWPRRRTRSPSRYAGCHRSGYRPGPGDRPPQPPARWKPETSSSSGCPARCRWSATGR